MTTLLAALAGALAAAGILELAWALSERPRAHALGRVTPVFALGALRRLGRGLIAPREKLEAQARLEAAGLGLPAGDLLAVKAGSAMVTLALCVPFVSSLPGRLGLTTILAIPAAAFLAPDAWVRRRTRARARSMEAELADVLDLLRVVVSAGFPADRGLREVGRRHAGLLAAELRRTAAELDLGVPTPTAYANLARRSPARGVPALVSALTRAERHGTSLTGPLAALAVEARATRARRATVRAAKAAPKIQLVVALLLVPSVLLLVAAALLPSLLG